jgi:hypothetical protein
VRAKARDVKECGVSLTSRQLQELREKYGYTEADVERFQKRGRLIIRFYIPVFILFVIGSLIAIPFIIPRETVCFISEQEWFRGLWGPNHQYAEVLKQNSYSKIDSCKLIAATSWGSALGITIFIVRMIIEFKFRESFNPTPLSPLKFYSIFLFLFLVSLASTGIVPFLRFLIITVNRKKSLFSISVFDNPVYVHVFFSIASIFAFILLAEVLAVFFIALRSDIKKWRSS